MKFCNPLILMLMIAFISGCDGSATQEMKRVTSPDKRVDAVLVEYLSGATAPDSFRLYIVPAGKPVSGDPIFVGDKFYGLDFGWSASEDLAILYAGGRIFKFTNFWQSSDMDNFRYTVTIHLSESNHPVFEDQ